MPPFDDPYDNSIHAARAAADGLTMFFREVVIPATVAIENYVETEGGSLELATHAAQKFFDRLMGMMS